MRKHIGLILLAGLIVFGGVGTTVLAEPPRLALPEQPHFAGGTVHVLCSSHNDLGWGGTPEQHLGTQRGVIRKALQRMRENADYRFNLEMSLSLWSFLAHPSTTPEEKEEVLKACREQRLSVGAGWTQPPESSLADEPLARSFLLGRRWLQSLGIESTTYWNEDCPGRALQIPQLCQRAGVKYLMLSRHRHGLHRWQAPDGSAVIAWSPWGDAYWTAMHAKFLLDEKQTRSGITSPDEKQMQGVLKAVQGMTQVAASRQAPAEVALLFSTDECPPQNADSLIRTWNTANPGGPTMRYSTVSAFLDKATVTGNIPKTYGEQPDIWMYEFHPGHRRSYETWRRAGERLPLAEIWASLDAFTANDWKRYPKERLDAAWRNTLTMDHAWRGGKIDVASRVIWQHALDAADEIERQSQTAIADRIKREKPNAIVVFNSLNWSRSDAAVVSLPEGLDPARTGVEDTEGTPVPSQVTGDAKGLCFVARDVPGLGWKTYHLVDRAPVATLAAPAVTTWENARLKVAFGKGGLTSLVDKITGRELLNPERYCAGEFCSMGTSGGAASEAPGIGGPKVASEVHLRSRETTWREVEHGAVRTVFRMEGATDECGVSLDAICWNDLPRVDLVLRLQSLTIARGRELRVAFPVALPGAEVRYGVPFGFVHIGKDDLDRAPGWSYKQISREATLREANRWISVADEKGGLAIGTSELVFDSRDPGRKLAYPVIMPLLLASVLESENGDYEHRFSLCPHGGDWRTGWRPALASQTPLACIQVAAAGKGTLPPRYAPLTVEGPGILLTALKRAEDVDSAVIRFVEMERGASTVNIQGPMMAAEETNLIEQTPQSLAVKNGNVALTVNPAEIRTVRLHRKTP